MPKIDFKTTICRDSYYYWLYLVFSVLLPVSLPMMIWGLDWYRSFIVMYIMRYIVTLHSTWFVNSAAHMFGMTLLDELEQGNRADFR